MGSEEKQKIQKGDLIHLDYDLWIADDNILFETTHKELAEENGITEENAVYKPIAVIIDEGKAVAGLYKSLLEAEVGKEYEIEVPPEEGLGNRDPKLVEWHMMNEIRRQKLEPVVGKSITIKDKNGREKTGFVTMVSPRRVRVDYNNPLAGKTLRYKYKVVDTAATAEEKVATILEMDFGKKDDFKIEIENDSLELKLPDVCKYDQLWFLAKYKVANDLREYAGFKKIRFIEEYLKKEEEKKEEGEEEKEAKEQEEGEEEKKAGEEKKEKAAEEKEEGKKQEEEGSKEEETGEEKAEEEEEEEKTEKSEEDENVEEKGEK